MVNSSLADLLHTPQACGLAPYACSELHNNHIRVIPRAQLISSGSLSVTFANINLKPLNNYLQRIKHHFSGVIMYKVF